MDTDRANSRERGGGSGSWARLLLPALVPVLAFGLVGCGDVFEVTNPGRILDEDLNNKESMENLVVGMSSDFSQLNSGWSEGIVFISARASDELAGSGSYTSTNLFARGIIRPQEVNAQWEGLHRARFNAEDGIERMRQVLGDDFQGNPHVARAHFFAAHSNVDFGENWCQVTFDGGPIQDPSTAFERGLDFAEQGLPHAQQAGTDDIETALIGTQAQAHAGLGNWDQAASLASQVPTDFVFEAVHSDNSDRERQVLYFETHNRFEASAFNTRAQEAWENGDPRVPMTDCRVADCPTDVGADGVTPQLRQEKFPDPGSNFPVVTGKEMRLIEAEAALRNGDPDEALAQINEMRTLWPELDDIDASEVGSYTGATSFDASDPYWSLLDRERYLTLWLEGKRLYDLQRWDHPFLDGGEIAHEPEPGKRDSCIPISQQERITNPNID